MPLAALALPPAAYMNFCQRKPLDCGENVRQVRAGATLVLAERDELARRVGPANMPPALGTASIDPAQGLAPIGPTAPRPSAPSQAGAVPEAVSDAITVLAAELISGESETPTEPPPTMNPRLWSLLNQVNGEVNGAIRQQPDLRTYGLFDYWNTPLEDGIRVGDCEDFVLEKQRALIKAGLPRSALNIAVVQTSWGELHAVLLVSTNEGEYVLDSLTRGVSRWRDAPYVWIRREVNGDAFRWATVDQTALRPREDKPFRGLLIALAR